jgi:HlyD family secretion protein
MNKKILLPMILIVAVVATTAFFYSEKEDTSTIRLFGNVDIRQVSLAFTQSERVKNLFVEEGDLVTKGDVIAHLDNTLLGLQLEQGQAQINAQKALIAKLEAGSRSQEITQAKASVTQQQAQVEVATYRLKRMLDVDTTTQGRGLSQQDIDDSRAQLQAMEAGLEQAQAQLELVVEGPRKEDIDQAKAQLAMLQAQQSVLQEHYARTQLVAPSDGVVRSRLLEPGDIASPQRPVVTLALTSPKWVRVYINEAQLPHIQLGQAADIQVDGLPGQAIQGSVSYISSVAEFTPKSVQTEDLRTSLVYEVRVRVSDPEGFLKLGMPVTVSVTAA